ncbi:MAG: 4-alpha-glucanotransferase [Burkholderiaceae bacterium]|nr:4-alpha-glucanotransferase [Burkholderiaceae bacterium]
MNLNQRASGVLLHVTSLPGPHGSGDFGPAAHHFIDWLHDAGQRLWQVLPLTPIGPGDSPYQSVSAFAGSPLLVALEPLVEGGWLSAPALAEAVAAAGFDATRVDYAKVVPWRDARLREAAAGFAARASIADRRAFSDWCRAQAHWLDDYALFMALEQSQSAVDGWRAWWDWDPPLARRDPDALAAASAGQADELFIWRFIQWCFDTQWQAVRVHARQRGVALMGDLPIFIAHHSADCWARPDLYGLDAAFQPTVVAGVPPDFFSATGQRWGNPLYRWDRMADEGYAWWIARVRRALDHADVFRIDHFRGFAACWEIPADCPTAIDGHWVPGPGRPLFDAIEQALGALPVVAEDLGVITPDVEALRDGLGLPGMRILHFAFGDDADNAYLPHRYVPNTVVYTGTHDNDTTRGWWQGIGAAERDYAALYLGLEDRDAAECDARVAWAAIRAASASVANLAVFPMQDVLNLDTTHRMNTPGTAVGNWTWRFDWAMVGAQPGPRLRRLSAAFGRCPFGRWSGG